MEDAGGRRASVFSRLTYEEVGVCCLEALSAMQCHRRAWKLARGTMPVADVILDPG